MPYDDPDATDPMTLCGVGVQTEDESAVLEMAVCFIEEYARLGFNAERILAMFRTAGYSGPALARSVLGEETIARLVREECSKWGPRGPGQSSTCETAAGLSLPVLE